MRSYVFNLADASLRIPVKIVDGDGPRLPVRGGAWYHDNPEYTRTSTRDRMSSAYSRKFVGLRLAVPFFTPA